MAEYDEAVAERSRSKRGIFDEYAQTVDSIRDAVDELFARLQVLMPQEAPQPDSPLTAIKAAGEPSEARRLLDGFQYQQHRLRLLLDRLEV